MNKGKVSTPTPFALVEWVGGTDDGQLSVVNAKFIYTYEESWLESTKLPERAICRYRNVDYIVKVYNVSRSKPQLEEKLQGLIDEKDAEEDDDGETVGSKRERVKNRRYMDEKENIQEVKKSKPSTSKPVSAASAAVNIVGKYMLQQQQNADSSSSREELMERIRCLECEKSKLEEDNERLRNLLADVPHSTSLLKENRKLKDLLVKDLPEIVSLTRQALVGHVPVPSSSTCAVTPARNQYQTRNGCDEKIVDVDTDSDNGSGSNTTPTTQQKLPTVELAPGLGVTILKAELKNIRLACATPTALARKLLSAMKQTYNFTDCNVYGGTSRTDAEGKRMSAMDERLRDSIIWYCQDKYPGAKTSAIVTAMNICFSDMRKKKK